MFLPIYRNGSRPRNSQDDHLDFIVYVFFDTLPGTEPHQVGVQVAARIQGPDHSDAVASRHGYVFEIHQILRLAEVPSPISRRHVQEADGVTEGLDRVAHSSVAREHRPGFGLNVLIGSRELDTAFVDAQRDWSGRGVLVEPITLLHYQ